MKKYHTYFFDIDGTIFEYRDFETYDKTPPVLTPGALEKLNEIHEAGHMIVLTTARPQYLVHLTKIELKNAGVPYSKLVMGLARGTRHLVNDMSSKEPGVERAIAWNLTRDEGLNKITVAIV